MVKVLVASSLRTATAKKSSSSRLNSASNAMGSSTNAETLSDRTDIINDINDINKCDDEDCMTDSNNEVVLIIDDEAAEIALECSIYHYFYWKEEQAKEHEMKTRRYLLEMGGSDQTKDDTQGTGVSDNTENLKDDKGSSEAGAAGLKGSEQSQTCNANSQDTIDNASAGEGMVVDAEQTNEGDENCKQTNIETFSGSDNDKNLDKDLLEAPDKNHTDDCPKDQEHSVFLSSPSSQLLLSEKYARIRRFIEEEFPHVAHPFHAACRVPPQNPRTNSSNVDSSSENKVKDPTPVVSIPISTAIAKITPEVYRRYVLFPKVLQEIQNIKLQQQQQSKPKPFPQQTDSTAIIVDADASDETKHDIETGNENDDLVRSNSSIKSKPCTKKSKEANMDGQAGYDTEIEDTPEERRIAMFFYRYHQLKEYKGKFGNCKVTIRDDPTGGPLRLWVWKIRELYQQQQNQLSFSKTDISADSSKHKPQTTSSVITELTQEQIKLLDQLQFEWNLDSTVFASTVKATTGGPDSSLSSLSPAPASTMLSSSSSLVTFDDYYTLLQSFHRQFGHIHVTEKYDVELARWIVNVRANYQCYQHVRRQRKAQRQSLLLEQQRRRREQLQQEQQELNPNKEQEGDRITDDVGDDTANLSSSLPGLQKVGTPMELSVEDSGKNNENENSDTRNSTDPEDPHLLTDGRISKLNLLGFEWEVKDHPDSTGDTEDVNNNDSATVMMIEPNKIFSALGPSLLHKLRDTFFQDSLAATASTETGNRTRTRNVTYKDTGFAGKRRSKRHRTGSDIMPALDDLSDARDILMTPFKMKVRTPEDKARVAILAQNALLVREQQWEKRFDELVKYKEENDTLQVPRAFSYTSAGDDNPIGLGEWVHKQRLFYHRKTMSSERIEKLNSIGFVWGDSEYLEKQVEEDNIDTETNDTNKNMNHLSRLTPEQITARWKKIYSELYFPSNPQLAFERYVEQIRQFVQKNGHGNIPSIIHKNKETGDLPSFDEIVFRLWVQEMRLEYRKKQQEQQSTNEPVVKSNNKQDVISDGRRRMKTKSEMIDLTPEWIEGLTAAGLQWALDETHWLHQFRYIYDSLPVDEQFDFRVEQIRAVVDLFGCTKRVYTRRVFPDDVNDLDYFCKQIRLLHKSWRTSPNFQHDLMSPERRRQLKDAAFDFDPRKSREASGIRRSLRNADGTATTTTTRGATNRTKRRSGYIKRKHSSGNPTSDGEAEDDNDEDMDADLDGQKKYEAKTRKRTLSSYRTIRKDTAQETSGSSTEEEDYDEDDDDDEDDGDEDGDEEEDDNYDEDDDHNDDDENQEDSTDDGPRTGLVLPLSKRKKVARKSASSMTAMRKDDEMQMTAESKAVASRANNATQDHRQSKFNKNKTNKMKKASMGETSKKNKFIIPQRKRQKQQKMPQKTRALPKTNRSSEKDIWDDDDDDDDLIDEDDNNKQHEDDSLMEDDIDEDNKQLKSDNLNLFDDDRLSISTYASE